MSKLGTASTATLHPLMRVAFDATVAADKAGASLWDSLATYAETDERKALDPKGIKRAIQAQIEAAAPSMPADWNPNTVSTFRVYRKLVQDAREFGVSVTVNIDGEVHARSVGDVRADVKAAKEAAKPADEGAAGEGEGKGEYAQIDSLPPEQGIDVACSYILNAYLKLGTLEAKAEAREKVAALLAAIS